MVENQEYEMINNCRVCGSKDLVRVLDLGKQPLANSLKKTEMEKEKSFPLSIVFCNNCSLVQLEETIDKEVLFSHYVWVTGTSETAKHYAEIFFNRTLHNTGLSKNDLVVEIASNDGTFLKPFIRNGFQVIGVDPAQNISDLANSEGIKTIAKFWDISVAKSIRETMGSAKVIIARNVIPHVSDLHNVIKGISECLSDDGTGIIEFHHAGKILNELHYDSIYHEHLCYFSMSSIKYLLNRYGLYPYHIDISPISGGSYVIYFSKNQKSQTKEYEKFEMEEEQTGINKLSAWQEFARKSEKHKIDSIEILKPFRGKTVIGFGSSARSSTYLNYCGFSSSDIKLIIDNNKLKQGMFSAGSSIPIVSFEKGIAENPDLIFVIAWNFLDEIVKECRNAGYKGPFLTPFPNNPYIIANNK